MELQSENICLSSEVCIDLKKISISHSGYFFSSDSKTANHFKEQNWRLDLHTGAEATVSAISPYFSDQPLYMKFSILIRNTWPKYWSAGKLYISVNEKILRKHV